MGSSHSQVVDTEEATATLSEQVSETCSFSCDNTMENVNIDIINSNVGGNITLSQACSVNANCTEQSAMSAVTDVLFSQKNSSQASNAGSLLSPLNFDSSGINSRLEITENISTGLQQHCGMSSVNEMDDVTVFAANSNIGGSIQLGQEGSTQGTCTMGNSMKAAATATGYQKSTSYSGKDKKAQKKGKTGMGAVLGGVGGLVVLLIVIMAVAHAFGGKKKKQPPKKPGPGRKGGVVPGQSVPARGAVPLPTSTSRGLGWMRRGLGRSAPPPRGPPPRGPRVGAPATA